MSLGVPVAFGEPSAEYKCPLNSPQTQMTPSVQGFVNEQPQPMNDRANLSEITLPLSKLMASV